MIHSLTPAARGGCAPKPPRAVWLWIILTVAALLRLPALDRCPPPLNQDEASRGYDAWCLLETGRDRHGASWPFFLESFGQGDYTASLSTLLTIPFLAVLGPTTTAMRLPDAICGVLTVVLLYAWLRRRFGVRVALLAAATLALDPWHISLCRTAHESGFAPFFLCAAMLCLDRAGLLGSANSRCRESVRGWAFAAGFAFALLAWIYPATRLFTPLFIFALWIIYRREDREPLTSGAPHSGWRGLAQPGDGHASDTASCQLPTRSPAFGRPASSSGACFRTPFSVVLNPNRSPSTRSVRPCHPRSTLPFVAGLMIGASPLWSTAVVYPQRLAARAGAALLDWSPAELPGSAWQFLRNYAANLSPSYLFMQADEMSGASIPGVGQHLLIAAPLVLAGFIVTLRRARTDRFARLLVAWLLVYPIPAAICGDWNPHIMRGIGGLPLFPIFAGVGGEWLWNASARRSPPVRRTLAIAFGLAAVANAAYFFDRYFVRFPPMAEAAYQTALYRAIRFAAGHADSVDFILVTNRANQPYIYALLAGPIPPRSLRGTPPVFTVGIAGFHHVARLGKYFFTPSEAPSAQAAFQKEWRSLARPAEGLVIERAGLWPAGEVLATFPSGDGRNPADNFEVRRWRLREDGGGGAGIEPR